MHERQIAHVGFDQFQHANVGRHPRERAKPDDQDRALEIARRLRRLFSGNLVEVLKAGGAASAVL